MGTLEERSPLLGSLGPKGSVGQCCSGAAGVPSALPNVPRLYWIDWKTYRDPAIATSIGLWRSKRMQEYGRWEISTHVVYAIVALERADDMEAKKEARVKAAKEALATMASAPENIEWLEWDVADDYEGWLEREVKRMDELARQGEL